MVILNMLSLLGNWLMKNIRTLLVLLILAHTIINKENSSSHTPLHLAITLITSKDQLNTIVKQLKDGGADFTIKDSNGKNAEMLLQMRE